MSAPNLKHGETVAAITIKVYADNAMSVEGPTDDPAWCVAALENAIDALRSRINPGRELIVPGKDVRL